MSLYIDVKMILSLKCSSSHCTSLLEKAQRCESCEYFPLELRRHAVDSIHILVQFCSSRLLKDLLPFFPRRAQSRRRRRFRHSPTLFQRLSSRIVNSPHGLVQDCSKSGNQKYASNSHIHVRIIHRIVLFSSVDPPDDREDCFRMVNGGWRDEQIV